MNYRDLSQRELDRENDRIMQWNTFWTAFDRLTKGDPEFADTERIMENREAAGEFPPHGFLKNLRQEVNNAR